MCPLTCNSVIKYQIFFCFACRCVIFMDRPTATGLPREERIGACRDLRQGTHL